MEVNKFHITPDFYVTGGIIAAGEPRVLYTQMQPEFFPPGTTYNDLQAYHESGRSRFAQAHLTFVALKQGIQALMLMQGVKYVEDLNLKGANIPVIALNDSFRDHDILNGPAVCLFRSGRRLFGDELENCGVLLNGEQPPKEAFCRNRRGMAVALRLRIDGSSRGYIPAGEKPISIDPYTKARRGHLKDWLVSPPDTFDNIPYIAVTEALHMPVRHHGVLATQAYSLLDCIVRGAQIRSLFFRELLDDPAIVEIIGPTFPGYCADTIDMTIHSME